MSFSAFSGIAIGVLFGMLSPMMALVVFSVLFAFFITYIKNKSSASADTIIGCDIVPKNYDADLLVVTSDGFGKRTKLSEFRSQNRGGIGLIATKFKSSFSRLVALTIVEESEEIMLVTANGIVTRIKAGDISCQGRPATGVRAQNLTDNDTVVSVTKIVNTDKDDDSDVPSSSCAMEEASEQQNLLVETSDSTEE